MKHIIYDESSDGKKIYNSGFSDGEFDWDECLLVAKYLRHSLGYGDARTKTEIIRFIESQDKSFNVIRNRNLISGILRHSKKPQIGSGVITIYLSEIQEIEKIRNFKYQKIALAAVLLAKRTKEGFGYINLRDWKNMKFLVSRKISSSDIQETMSRLFELGLLSVVGASHRLDFLNAGNGSTPVFSIFSDSDALSLVSKYVSYYGGEVGYCTKCGTSFIKSHYKKKLCGTCSEHSRLAKYKKYNRKRNEKI